VNYRAQYNGPNLVNKEWEENHTLLILISTFRTVIPAPPAEPCTADTKTLFYSTAFSLILLLSSQQNIRYFAFQNIHLPVSVPGFMGVFDAESNRILQLTCKRDEMLH
jgi:hypothetical protein